MFVYVVILISINVFSIIPYSKHQSRQSVKIFLWLSFSVMAIVLGLRGPSVGEDTEMYLSVFRKAIAIDWKTIFSNFFSKTVYSTLSFGYDVSIESGYLALCKVLFQIFNNEHICLFVVSCLICFLFAKFIYENSCNVVISTLVFLTESMFMNSFNIFRQLLAIAIGIQAYKYIKNKQLKGTLIYIFLAYLIHNSAIILLLMIPLRYIEEKKEKKVFKYVILAAIVLPFFIVFMSTIIIRYLPQYGGYFNQNYWTISIGGGFILWVIEVGLILYIYRKGFPTKDSFKLSYLITLYLSLEIMSLSITMIGRVSYYFRAFLILFFPVAFFAIKPKYRKFVKYFTLLFLVFLYFAYASAPARKFNFIPLL